MLVVDGNSWSLILLIFQDSPHFNALIVNSAGNQASIVKFIELYFDLLFAGGSLVVLVLVLEVSVVEISPSF